MLSLWDARSKDTLRIDLWTKDMELDDMKRFFHQTLLSMADSYDRATNETEMAEDFRDFARYFAEQQKLG
jgi:gliding motility-associated protein GldC